MGPWAGISMFAVDLTHEDAIPDEHRRSRPRPPNTLDIPHTSSRHGNDSDSVDADSTTATQRSSTGDADPPRDGEVRRDLNLMEQIQRMASNITNTSPRTNFSLFFAGRTIHGLIRRWPAPTAGREQQVVSGTSPGDISTAP